MEPQFPQDLEGLINAEILEEENDNICRMPFSNDIRRVVFEMHPLKTPGPDGLPRLFYRHY